jgi:hypothetical protein
MGENHQSATAKTQEKSLITPVKSCMSKLMDIFPGGNKEKGMKISAAEYSLCLLTDELHKLPGIR